MSDPCPRMDSSGQWSGYAVMVSSLVSGLVMVSSLISSMISGLAWSVV